MKEDTQNGWLQTKLGLIGEKEEEGDASVFRELITSIVTLFSYSCFCHDVDCNI